jgi:glutamate-1-semialdehyde 2,1-aminomutase
MVGVAQFVVGAGFGAGLTWYLATRLARAYWTLTARAWMPVVARRLSSRVRARPYDADALLTADGAGAPWIERRRHGLDRLAMRLRTQHVRSIAWGDEIRDGFSDLRFTDASRVPFPFVRAMRDTFSLCSVVTESRGPNLKDLDGNWTIDVGGSYGVNVAGFDRYKTWMARGLERVKDLGPVLGPLHPVVAENIALLKQISQLDEVSFHMSGTEAVMAAVRVVRFNIRRKLIVCFSGAYHGWWDGVQPGLGSERAIEDCLTLRDMDPAALRLISKRASEIAGVLVNPVQSFHPNSPPPNDAVLLTSGARKIQDSTERYRDWLRQLRAVCSQCDVPLIFDEVYTGFRLAPGGAQEYFGVRADVVTYGKTVGGGMPIGVVCGRRELMKRADPDRPMRMAYVVGTFSAHPVVMGAMNEFLHWLMEPDTAAEYASANARCSDWAHGVNQRMAALSLPVRIVNLGTVWTVLFSEPSRFSWLFQYYLRAEGVTLSWVGTGRCLSSLDFTDEHYRDLDDKLCAAAQTMKGDGWWLTAKEFPERDARMKQSLIREIAGSLVPVPGSLAGFYNAVMQRKEDDHHASHNNRANQALHVFSSSVFIYCYVAIFSNLTTAMCLGLAALFARQFGHAILEPACHDEEKLLLGYTTRDKTLIVGGYALIPIIDLALAGGWTFAAFRALLDQIALHWFRWTVFVVALRVAVLTWKHDFRISMIWFVKLITDPMTDLMSYLPALARRG